MIKFRRRVKTVLKSKKQSIVISQMKVNVPVCAMFGVCLNTTYKVAIFMYIKKVHWMENTSAVF